MKECAVEIVCEPGIGGWCCDELMVRVCDEGETCECRDDGCTRPFVLVEGKIRNVETNDQVTQCPHCGAKIL